jgi:hypothetical protein
LVEFNEPVIVTVGSGGAPYIPFNLNGKMVNATYIDQAPSVDQSGLLFEYKVQTGDKAAAGEVTLNGIKAKKSILTGTSGLTYTAKTAGAAGNDITVAYVDPSGNDQALAVTVTEKAISVSLATGAEGAITSTAADIKTAIEASTDAAALVAVTLVGATGAGVVTAVEATALEDGVTAPTGIVLPTNTTITDKDETPSNATVTFGEDEATPDLSKVTIN